MKKRIARRRVKEAKKATTRTIKKIYAVRLENQKRIFARVKELAAHKLSPLYKLNDVIKANLTIEIIGINENVYSWGDYEFAHLYEGIDPRSKTWRGTLLFLDEAGE